MLLVLVVSAAMIAVDLGRFRTDLRPSSGLAARPQNRLLGEPHRAEAARLRRHPRRAHQRLFPAPRICRRLLQSGLGGGACGGAVASNRRTALYTLRRPQAERAGGCLRPTRQPPDRPDRGRGLGLPRAAWQGLAGEGLLPATDVRLSGRRPEGHLGHGFRAGLWQFLCLLRVLQWRVLPGRSLLRGDRLQLHPAAARHADPISRTDDDRLGGLHRLLSAILGSHLAPVPEL